jgi:O-antigen/teichoic acid export membrane protein
MLKQIGRDVAIYGSGDLAFRLLGFLVFPIYAHVFSVQEFGVYALISTTTGVVTLCAGLGLSMATTRYYWDTQITPAMRPTVVSSGLAVLLVWSTAIVLLAIAGAYPARGMIASRYAATLPVICIALVTVVPELILQYCLNVLRLHFSPWKFTLVSFFKNVFGVAVGLVLILLFGGGLWGLFAGALAGAFIGSCIALVLISHELTMTFNLPLAKRLVSFGYPFIFAGLAYAIFGSVDRWMLAELSNTTQLGLYAIAYKFAGVLLFVNSAFGQAWSPIALKLMREEPEYRLSFSRVLSGWFFFLAVTGAAIALSGNEVLRMLTPREYWTAAPALAPLIMGVVLSGTTQITGVGISLENKTRLFATAAWTTALTNVLLNFLLIPRWGALGAGIATFLSYGMLTSLYLFWSQRLHPIPLEKAKLLYSTALVVGIVAFCAAQLDVPDWPVLTMIAKLGLLALIIVGGSFLGIVNLSAVKELGGWTCKVNNELLNEKNRGVDLSGTRLS